MAEPRNYLLGSKFSTRKQRRTYVAVVSAATCCVLAYAFFHPENRIGLAVLVSTAFWMQAVGKRRRWDPTVPVPENASELQSSDVVVLQAFKLLSFIWIIAAAGIAGLCLSSPYAQLSSWHSSIGVALYGLAVFTVDLPKALVIWAQGD